MPRNSAGLLLYRMRDGALEVLLVHPGGPFFKNKEEGAWTIPKGEINDGEDVLAAACREFAEETGLQPAGDFLSLAKIKQKSGKVVHAWSVAGEFDPTQLVSNTFQIEWPPKSGKQMEFPEVDRAGWFPLAEARLKMNPAQVAWLDELSKKISPAT
ncbi:NUDIX domain-containing protein [Anatilimnocola floriformis]|uniref:NUDIX domain-containing protein n=1 Tax=Anatilimnocola floriformis TaxID=2948575 RepID=UPI0020C1FE79|nr:NUDIX domain-containing protein [Anatilimnocola floriformis]